MKKFTKTKNKIQLKNLILKTIKLTKMNNSEIMFCVVMVNFFYFSFFYYFLSNVIKNKKRDYENGYNEGFKNGNETGFEEGFNQASKIRNDV